MRRLRALALRLTSLFDGAAADRDFADELESHLQLHIDDKIRSGMSPEQARRAALLKLGGVAQTRERYRDRRGLPLVDALRQDLVYAVRVLRRAPGFTLTAVVTLALGIGANTAIFNVVNAVLLQPLPFTDPDRVVMIFATDSARHDVHDVASYPDYADWSAQRHSFDSMAAYSNRSLTLGASDGSVLVQGKRVTPSLFAVLGVQPAIGRAFRTDEQQPGASAVVILSDGFWKQHYGGATDVLGKAIRINEEPHTIIGVMPSSFHVERSTADQFYVPLPIDPNRGHGFLRVIARLHRGTTVAKAQADLEVVAARLSRIYPKTNARVGVNVMSMTAGLTHNARLGLLLMLGVVGLVLLVACANVAGLMLARGASRQRELAVRAALGAGRGRLARQLLAESVLIAGAGGALGLAAAAATARALAVVIAENFRMPPIDATGMAVPVLAFTLLLSIVTGVSFGIVPAFMSAAPDLSDALRGAGRSTTGARAPRLRSVLVILETALALVLLAGAGVLLKTFLTLRGTPPGFEASHVLAVDLWLTQSRFTDVPARARFFDAVLERLHGMPHVRSAAFVADLPLNGGTDHLGFHIIGRPDPSPGTLFTAGFNVATAAYFQTLGIPILAGREFVDADRANTAPVIVVNETAARRFWPGESPIGARIQLPGAHSSTASAYDSRSDIVLAIVGVAGDVHHVGLAVPPRAEIFLNSMQAPLNWPWLTLAVRSNDDPAALAAPVKAAVREVTADVPILAVTPLEAIVARSIFEPRLYAFLVGAFATLAAALAAIGLYGLVSYSVSQRTHELGVRVALGAARREILRLVLSQALALAGAGAVIGLATAAVVVRVLTGLTAGVEPGDPMTLVIATSVLVVSAAAASYVPALRAASVDPMIALRSE